MDVELWRVDLDQGLALEAVLSQLSAEERHRADAFQRPQLRQRYIAAHWALRRILARYLQREPQALRLLATEYGKPYLAEARGFCFNLSHSGRLALIAVGLADGDIGVDIEQMRADLDFDEIATLCFSAAERSRLQCASSEERLRCFFETWTRKEAYAKGRGLGLSLDLRQCCTAGPMDRPVQIPPAHDDDRYWYLSAPAVPQGYAAALACTGREPAIRCFSDSSAQ